MEIVVKRERWPTLKCFPVNQQYVLYTNGNIAEKKTLLNFSICIYLVLDMDVLKGLPEA